MNSLEQRKEKFMWDVAAHLDKYPKQMLRDFYDYWSEHNEGGKKMRWEFQKVFNIRMRLATWAKNQNKFNNTKNERTSKGITESTINATKGAFEILKNRWGTQSRD